MLDIDGDLQIPDDELVERSVRSAGPGGQNVNKVSSAVQMRFDVRNSPSLPDGVRERLEKLAGRRLTMDGVLVISAQQFRTQERNRADAMERLVALIREAAIVPIYRRPTRPTLGSKRRRLEEKGRRATVKTLRGRPPDSV